VQSRRVKIISIDENLFVDVLNWCAESERGKFLCIPTCEAIPEGTEVVSVSANWSRRCLEAMITHPTFDEVPVGECPPVIPDLLKTEMRVIKGKVTTDACTSNP
jgi:hypothetical protein